VRGASDCILYGLGFVQKSTSDFMASHPGPLPWQVFTVIYAQTSERGVGVSLGVQSEVDRSDGVCGTNFGMSASPTGRK
jgi:hypothetical protein